LDSNLAMKQLIERIKQLAASSDSFFVIVGGCVPALYLLNKDTGLTPRPTVDIDIATREPGVGREIVSSHRDLDVQALCPESLADGAPGVSFLPDVELAFEDFREIALADNITVRVASPLAFFVLKLNRAKRTRYKRGSDLYDLLLVTQVFGPGEIAKSFKENWHLHAVKRSLSNLRWLIGQDSGPGFSSLFEEMNLDDDFYGQMRASVVLKELLHLLSELEE
jgi:hypothetical protein